MKESFNNFNRKEVKEDVDTRMDAAENPDTPPDTLVKLAEDEDKEVKEDVDVRRNIAEDPDTPPETLVTPAEDKDRDIRNAARKSL